MTISNWDRNNQLLAGKASNTSSFLLHLVSTLSALTASNTLTINPPFASSLGISNLTDRHASKPALPLWLNDDCILAELLNVTLRS